MPTPTPHDAPPTGHNEPPPLLPAERFDHILDPIRPPVTIPRDLIDALNAAIQAISDHIAPERDALIEATDRLESAKYTLPENDERLDHAAVLTAARDLSATASDLIQRLRTPAEHAIAAHTASLQEAIERIKQSDTGAREDIALLDEDLLRRLDATGAKPLISTQSLDTGQSVIAIRSTLKRTYTITEPDAVPRNLCAPSKSAITAYLKTPDNPPPPGITRDTRVEITLPSTSGIRR